MLGSQLRMVPWKTLLFLIFLLPPPDVKYINFYIWADKDIANSQGTRAGIEAAQRLQSRMVEFFG